MPVSGLPPNVAGTVVTVGTFVFKGQRYARDMPLAVTSNPGDPPPPAANIFPESDQFR